MFFLHFVCRKRYDAHKTAMGKSFYLVQPCEGVSGSRTLNTSQHEEYKTQMICTHG